MDKKRLFKILGALCMVTILQTACGAAGSGTAELTGDTENASEAAEESPSDTENASEAAGETPSDTENASDPAEETSSNTESASEAAEESPEEGDMEDVRPAVNEFTKKLFDSYSDEGNLFFSPFSIESAVALSGLAAKGETADGINRALSIEDPERFRAGLGKYISREQSESAYFKSANAIYISKSLQLSPDHEKTFVEPAKKYFDGEFKQVDFTDTEAVKGDIKAWVGDKTDGMIPDYEPGISKDTVADILNAVYFYGEWKKCFLAGDTYNQTFYGADKECQVEMMHMEDEEFRYLPDHNGVKAVALPYRDSGYEMDILMNADSENRDVTGLLKDGSFDDIFTELDKAGETELGMLAIPRFKMDVSLAGLKEKLITMGMDRAFSDGADFSGLAEDIKITDIIHRAVVEVDEEGSRAAAVTEIMMELTAVPVDEPKEEFIADRPFVFFIRDRDSGMVLFAGRFSGEE